MAELALAIASFVPVASHIVAKIVHKANEVRHFKDRSKELGKHATLLQALLSKHQAAIDSFDTFNDFQTCLTNIDKFVTTCHDMRILDVTREVFIKRSYPLLLKQIGELKEVFLLESVAEILSREGVHFASIDSEQVSQRQILAELQAANRQAEAERGVSSLLRTSIAASVSLSVDGNISFPDTSGGDDDHNVGYAQLHGIGVACYKISLHERSVESIQIYKKLQAGAFVQQYYGVAEEGGQTYAVMEDLRSGKTLAQACQEQDLPLEFQDKAQMACDIAKTMAWFHHAEMILKTITDETVVLKVLPSGKKQCVIARTENARNIFERTTGYTDFRFAAPEYVRSPWKVHSTHTDVWTLGTAIWQIMSGGFPFGIKGAIFQENLAPPGLLEKLQAGTPPGDVEHLRAPAVIKDLIQRCWDREPMQRMTASEVARILQDFCITLNAGYKTESSEIPTPLQDDNLTPEASDANDRAASAIRRGLQLIKDIRSFNKGNKTRTIWELKEKLSAEEFNFLACEDKDWSPLKYFVVGAVIWWKLADASVVGLLGEPAVCFQLGPNEKRARLALQYLEAAAGSGYEEAFFEMYKAHSQLATEMKARAPR